METGVVDSHSSFTSVFTFKGRHQKKNEKSDNAMYLRGKMDLDLELQLNSNFQT